MLSYCIGLLILLFIVFLVKYYYYLRRIQDKYLAGIWSGDKEFLKKSELKDLQLFIAPERDSGNLKAFLTMTDKDGDVITMQVIWINNSAFNSNIKFIYSDKDFSAIPVNATMNVDHDKGTMMIYADSKLYAFLIKNNEMSMVANDTYTAS